MNHLSMLLLSCLPGRSNADRSRPVIARVSHAKAYVYRDTGRKRLQIGGGGSNLREVAGVRANFDGKGSKQRV